MKSFLFKFLVTICLAQIVSCTHQTETSVFHTKNQAYPSTPRLLVVPKPGAQFVVLHPNTLEKELQIDRGLTDIMLKLFWAGLLSPLSQSKIKLKPSDKQLVLDITPVNASISQDFQIKAFLPPQTLNSRSNVDSYLIIHEWSLGYGLTAKGFYDLNKSREISEPGKARTLNTVLSYSVWDSKNAQVIQHGVVEAGIPRSSSWQTEDFKSLAIKLNLELHRQLGGVDNE